MLFISFSSAAILAVVYLQSVWLIMSQYQQIWYDSMNNCDNWSKFNGNIECGYSSINCPNSPCARMESEDSAGYAFLERTTTISAYSSLQIQFSVTTYSMESGDYCNVYFQYDDEWIDDTFNLLCSINPPNDGGYNTYNNQECDLLSSVGKSTLIIWLENDAEAGDYCYWDSVYLRGISEAQATPEPTPKPTNKPTSNPTNKPTSNPTKRPTFNPSKKPTNKPTSNPTKGPSSNPSQRPTDPDPTACGESVIGSYHGVPVTFLVNIPFRGNLEFNAAPSSFVVTDIEAFTKLNMALATDTDNNERVTLYDTPAGDYKFVINGEGSASAMAIFEVRITCTSPNTTLNPSKKAFNEATLAPSSAAEPSLSPIWISEPTKTPTLRPTEHINSDDDDDDDNEGEYDDRRHVNYTISITLRDCADEFCVELVENDITQTSTTFLTNSMDQEIEHKSTQIDGNSMEIVVTILMKTYSQLDSEQISNKLEKELKDNYGNVDVEIHETEAMDPDSSEEDMRRKDGFIAGLNSFFSETVVYVLVGCFLFIIMCAIAAIAVVCIYFGLNKKWKKDEFEHNPKHEQNMKIATEILQSNICHSASVVNGEAIEMGSGAAEGLAPPPVSVDALREMGITPAFIGTIPKVSNITVEPGREKGEAYYFNEESVSESSSSSWGQTTGGFTKDTASRN